jgi:hypothetical protein
MRPARAAARSAAVATGRPHVAVWFRPFRVLRGTQLHATYSVRHAPSNLPRGQAPRAPRGERLQHVVLCCTGRPARHLSYNMQRAGGGRSIGPRRERDGPQGRARPVVVLRDDREGAAATETRPRLRRDYRDSAHICTWDSPTSAPRLSHICTHSLPTPAGSRAWEEQPCPAPCSNFSNFNPLSSATSARHPTQHSISHCLDPAPHGIPHSTRRSSRSSPTSRSSRQRCATRTRPTGTRGRRSAG